MKYIIALLALFPNRFIQAAQKQFLNISEGYLLSEQSLPHITLAQFYLDSDTILSEIWRMMQHSSIKSVQPKIIGIGLTKKAEHLWGVSLSVERDPELVTLHYAVLDALKHYNVMCTNACGEHYRPHVTLARITEPQIVHFDDQLLEDTPFVLVLGQVDEQGQYLATFFKQDEL